MDGKHFLCHGKQKKNWQDSKRKTIPTKKKSHLRFHRELEDSCKMPKKLKNKAHNDLSSTRFNWETHSRRIRQKPHEKGKPDGVGDQWLSYPNSKYPQLANKLYSSWDILGDNGTLNVKVNNEPSTSQSMFLKIVARWHFEQKLTLPNWVKWGLKKKEFI